MTQMRRDAEFTQATGLHPFYAALEAGKGPARSKNEPLLHAVRNQLAPAQADLVSDVNDIAPAGLRPFADPQVLYFETFWHLAVGARLFLDRHLPILLRRVGRGAIERPATHG